MWSNDMKYKYMFMIPLNNLARKWLTAPYKWPSWKHRQRRGAPLEVQNGTQQDLNEMIDLVNLGGKKIVYMMKTGLSKWDLTRSEWNGRHGQILGGKKNVQMLKIGGKTAAHTYWLSKRECQKLILKNEPRNAIINDEMVYHAHI